MTRIASSDQWNGWEHWYFGATDLSNASTSWRNGETTHQPSLASMHASVRVRIVTLNLHKGFSALGRRDVLHGIRSAVRRTRADVLLLQEVVGDANQGACSQYEFLADSIWNDHAYGRNAISDVGHHGNAILSRYPILEWRNHDVSMPGREPRGLLQCRLAIPGHERPLHVFCVHFGLKEAERRMQLRALSEHVASISAAGDPVVVAGDFNDWRHTAHRHLLSQTDLVEVHGAAKGRLARTFPARWPVLALDRIYVGQVRAKHPVPLPANPWARLSDHAPLAAEILL